MKIFISWSGSRSGHIAATFHWWLPHLIQACKPFISQQNIEKGTRGSVTISKELEEANVGIICLTPENLDKPWIMFESGALSKLAVAHVCTFLYELEWTDVKPPLGEFQHTKNTKEDIWKLCQDINALQTAPLDISLLREVFEKWYPDFDDRLKSKMPARPEDEQPAEKRTEDSKLDEILKLLRQRELPSIPFTASVMNYMASRPKKAMHADQLTLDEFIAVSPNVRAEIEKFIEELNNNGGVMAVDKVENELGYEYAVKRGLTQVRIEDGGLVVRLC